jgi:small subunit ribosomal protein S7
MPRNFKSTAPLQKPDPKFGSLLATKIINQIMKNGKKTSAQEIFSKAIDNIRPSVEVRSKRVGGANYQVPREVKRNRQQSLAIRWFVDNARKKKGKPMAKRVAEELVDAYNGTGASVTWKENVHKMAEANKAYAHYAR